MGDVGEVGMMSCGGGGAGDNDDCCEVVSMDNAGLHLLAVLVELFLDELDLLFLLSVAVLVVP
jgi:hypothetical protein